MLRRASDICRQIFSRHTRRVVILNVAGLVALVIGILHLSQFRADLIGERIQSLEVVGEIIANAIVATVTDSDNTWYEPDRPLQLRPDPPFNSPDDSPSIYKFSLNPERIGAKLIGLIMLTNTRGRIYDNTGSLVIDTNDLIMQGDILRFDLPPPIAERPGFFKRAWRTVKTSLNQSGLPVYHELGPNSGKDYPEIAKVLDGAPTANMVRVDEREEIIVSVAVPIKSMRAVQGTLLLTSRGGDLNEAAERQQLVIMKVFLIVTTVMVLLSLMLTATTATDE